MVGGVAIVMAVLFIVLWAVSPKMTDESVLVYAYGWGAARSVLVVMYGLPVLTLLGLAMASFKEVLGKKHYQVERTLTLGGRDATMDNVFAEMGKVDAKRQALRTHRSYCPTCLAPLELVEGGNPVVCHSCGNTWPPLPAFVASLRAYGRAAEATRLETSLRGGS